MVGVLSLHCYYEHYSEQAWNEDTWLKCKDMKYYVIRMESILVNSDVCW